MVHRWNAFLHSTESFIFLFIHRDQIGKTTSVLSCGNLYRLYSERSCDEHCGGGEFLLCLRFTQHVLLRYVYYLRDSVAVELRRRYDLDITESETFLFGIRDLCCVFDGKRLYNHSECHARSVKPVVIEFDSGYKHHSGSSRRYLYICTPLQRHGTAKN